MDEVLRMMLLTLGPLPPVSGRRRWNSPVSFRVHVVKHCPAFSYNWGHTSHAQRATVTADFHSAFRATTESEWFMIWSQSLKNLLEIQEMILAA